MSPGRAFVYACHRLYRCFFFLFSLLLLLLLLSLLPYLGFYSQRCRCRCQPGIVAWRTAFLWHIFRCCCCLNEAFETAPKGNLVSVSHLAHCCRFKNIYTRTHTHIVHTQTHAHPHMLSTLCFLLHTTRCACTFFASAFRLASCDANRQLAKPPLVVFAAAFDVVVAVFVLVVASCCILSNLLIRAYNNGQQQ